MSYDKLNSVQCCIMSTETIRTIRDRKPRTATPTLTQLLSSECAMTGIRLLLLLLRKQKHVTYVSFRYRVDTEHKFTDHNKLWSLATTTTTLTTKLFPHQEPVSGTEQSPIPRLPAADGNCLIRKKSEDDAIKAYQRLSGGGRTDGPTGAACT